MSRITSVSCCPESANSCITRRVKVCATPTKWSTPADPWMLPEDGESGTTSNKFADQRVVTRSLPEGSTTRLLKEVPNAYQSRIDDVLLTALVQSVCEWTGHSGLYLELEGHGREPMSDALDASRTIGWFTTVYPAYLSVTPSEKPEEALRSIMAQLRAIPRKGVGYGMLRYLADDATRARLAAFPRPQVNFNYLGQFDQVLGGSAMFCLAPESTGPDFSEEAERPHLLEVVGAVIEGRLEVEWMYNQHIHASGTIERIADGFMMRLEALVDHCVAVGSDGMTSDGLTLSDFEDFAWDQSDLEEIAGAVQRARGGK